jgi:hypothetical protein
MNKPGWKTSEFWLHLVAIVLPVVAAVVSPLLVATANPVGIAAAALLTSLAANYGASQYSAARTEVKLAVEPPAAH